MLSKKTTLYYLGFFLISIIALWQIVFYVYPVKYDMIDCYLPWRFFIGECLQSGKFPYWNPYQDLGYPIHADPSSGTWYPFVWIIGSTVGYSVYTIGLEYWIHVFFAAIGFYKLCKTLKLNDESAFLAGISYMLCGVFIGNAQHLTYTVSACWIPFILNYYLRFAEDGSVFSATKTALFIFLLLTGGYPAFTITLFYLLLILFFYFGGNFIIKQKNKSAFIKFIRGNFIILLLTVLMAGGMLLSVYEVTPFLNRTNGFNLNRALFCPFSPQSMISFVFPFASINNMEFYDTDLSMSNAYFGILAFVFFIAGVFIKKPPLIKLFLFFAIFSLFASFGKYMPVRKFLYDYIPLMNLFRFPSTFRLFTIIGFLLLAFYAFNSFWDTSAQKNRKRIMLIIVFFIVTFLSIIIICKLGGYVAVSDFTTNIMLVFSGDNFLPQHIVINALLQIFVLSALFFCLLKITERKKLFLLLSVIVAGDLIISTQLNSNYTVYYNGVSAKESDKHLQKFPKGFPMIPDNTIAETDPHEMYVIPFWKNVTIFQKQISADGFNSFALTGHEYFRDETPQLYNETIKNKIVFLSDEIHPESELEKMKTDSSFTNHSLFFNTDNFEFIKKNNPKTDSSDKITLVDFAPNKFVAETETKNKTVLTLLQSNYKGWKAYVNNTETAIFTSNKSIISILVPSGKNRITFEYTNSKIKFAFIISATSILFVLFAIVFQNRILNLWQQKKK